MRSYSIGAQDKLYKVYVQRSVCSNEKESVLVGLGF